MYGPNRTIGVQSEHSGLFTEHYFEINNLAPIMRLHNCQGTLRRAYLWYLLTSIVVGLDYAAA